MFKIESNEWNHPLNLLIGLIVLLHQTHQWNQIPNLYNLHLQFQGDSQWYNLLQAEERLLYKLPMSWAPQEPRHHQQQLQPVPNQLSYLEADKVHQQEEIQTQQVVINAVDLEEQAEHPQDQEEEERDNLLESTARERVTKRVG